MLPVTLIKTSLNVIYFSGLAAALRKPLQGRGSIFCLHHVVPSHLKHGEFGPNSKLEISPEFLSYIIQFVRKRGYETMSLSEAIASLQKPAKNQKPFAVFTLDDGYKDNLINAQPVFKKLNCPYTVYVAPGIVEGSAELWWRALEKIIAENLSIFAEISGFTHSYKTVTTAEKNNAWNALSVAMLLAPETEQREVTRELAKRYAIDLKSMCLESAMNWEEIQQLAQDPLCTIGAHTLGHFAIRKLDVSEATKELSLSKKIIEQRLNREVQHFAFPYGDESAAGSRDFKLAAQAGFASSVTTRLGVVTALHANHLQALPRVMVSGRYAKLRYLDTLTSGVPGFIRNRFKIMDVN